jgi:peptide/nickel transport system substrate-binding protein
LNFNSTGNGGTAGAIMSQLPVRQAMQTLVDQTIYLQKLYHNYGVPAYGPVPVYPPNPFETKFEQSNPYPYSVKAAESFLKGDGWSIAPGGTDVCAATKGCGKGVPKGTKLSLSMQYAAGNPTFEEQNVDETEAWEQVGIHVTLTSATFDVVAGTATACKPSASCKWEIQNFGGWVYSPDYYPTGEDLYETGAISNAGSYSNPKADTLIKETDFSDSNTAFDAYENYMAKQIPVLFQPNPTYDLIEIKNDVTGFTPVNPLLVFNPENWRFKS